MRVLTSNAAGGGLGETLSVPTGHYTAALGVPAFYGRVRLGEDISPEQLAELPASVAWADLVHVTALWSPASLAALSYALLPAPACALARLRRGQALPTLRPVVLSPRGALLPWAMAQRAERKRGLLRWLRPLLQRVAGWHATSAQEAEAIKRLRLCGPGASIAVVGNGVSLPPVETPADPGIDRLLESLVAQRGPRIVTLGRVHPVKNLELAIAALARLRRLPAGEGAVLLIAGPERAGEGYGTSLRALAATLGVTDAVHFLGLVHGPAKDALLSLADALWLPSHMESFGNVVPEALAAGTPVVAADSTPWRELEALRVGRCLPADSEVFAVATAQLLGLYPRAQWRERCRAVAEARYSWSQREAELRALYDDLLLRRAQLLGQ